MPREFDPNSKIPIKFNATPEFRKLLAYVAKVEGFESASELLKHLVADYAYVYHGLTVQDFEQFSVQDIETMQKRLALEIDKRTRAEKELQKFKRGRADRNRQIRDILKAHHYRDEIINQLLD